MSYYVEDGRGGFIRREVVSSAEKLALSRVTPKRSVRVSTVPYATVADYQLVGTAVWKDGKPAWVPGKAKEWRTRSVPGPEGRGLVRAAFPECQARWDREDANRLGSRTKS